MRIRGLSMHKFTAHRWYNSRQEKGAGRWAVRGERWKKEEKRWEGRRNNGPSYAARAVLSWSQSLNCGQWPGRAHGNRWIPAPACTLDTPGGERWNAPHLGSGCTGSEVGWKLAGWLRETGLGRASGRGKAWMGHIMGQAHNNSTRAQDEHMQHHITSSITLTMTHATSKTLHERERKKAHLSVAGPGGHQLDHIWVPLCLSENPRVTDQTSRPPGPPSPHRHQQSPTHNSHLLMCSF